MLWIHEPRPEEKIQENVNEIFVYCITCMLYIIITQIDANFTIRPPP